MNRIRLTMAQALVKFLDNQFVALDAGINLSAYLWRVWPWLCGGRGAGANRATIT